MFEFSIYDYFESPDIAKHCQSINHEFSPLDMAVIVDRSGKPLKDKHSAYRAIITDYHDMPIHESLNFEAKDSLHNYLRELISRNERVIEDFYTSGEGIAYYNSVILCKKSRSPTEYYRESDYIYSSAERALAAFKSSRDWENVAKPWANIFKVLVDMESYILAEFNTDGDMLDISANGKEKGWIGGSQRYI